jgi:hypothetical protein
MTSGCGGEVVQPRPSPIVVETAPYRCPPVSDAVREAFAAKVPTPKPPIDKSMDRKWHDDKDALLDRKTAAGMLQIKEYEDCRNGPAERPVG